MARLNAQYGPLVYLRLGCVHTVTTDSPEIIKELTSVQDEVFCDRPRTSAWGSLTYDGLDVAGASMGAHWKMMRRICLEHLLTTRRLDAYQNYRTQESQAMVHAIWEEAERGRVCEFRHHLGALGMNVMTNMLLGRRYFGDPSVGAEESSAFRDILHTVLWLLGVFNIGDYLPYLKWLDLQGYDKMAKDLAIRIDNFYDPILQEHKQRHRHDQENGSSRPQDFVDVLLSLPGENPEDNLSDAEVKALIHDLITGATDTSSVMSEWAMVEMLKNPSVMERARAEIDEVVGTQRSVEEKDLNKLIYLKAVMKETFRKHPAGGFLLPHQSMKHAKVAGYDIPKGTRVLVNLYGLGRNPAIWEKVDEFLPERFLTNDSDATSLNLRDPKFRTLPFGAGKRQCPGAQMGQMMVMLALSRLIHSFDWSLPPPMTTQDIDMREEFGLVTPPCTPLQAIATPRLPISLY